MESPLFLYIRERDEITDVLVLIEQAKDQCVYLICPSKSVLLMSIVNVRLIKKWGEKHKKQIAIITQDRVTRNILAQAGIATFKDKNEVAFVQANDRKKQEQPEEKKVDKPVYPAIAWIVERFPSLFRDQKEQLQMVFIRPSHRAFLALFIFGIGVFFVVAFFAIPDATIEVSPVNDTTSVRTNVTLSLGPSIQEEMQVHMEPIDVTFDHVLYEPVTGQSERGTRSRGKVKLLNNSLKPWPLLGNSRLQTPDGLVFLTTKFVTIPARTTQGPGELITEVEARDVDARNVSIGKRGNIGPTSFTLPGLSSQNQRIITAISEESFSGGESLTEVFVTKEDLERANKNIVQELKNRAPEHLLIELKKRTEGKEGTYDIFQIHDDRFVKSEVVAVSLPNQLIGQKKETVEVKGTLRVHAYYYKQQDFHTILKGYVQKHYLTTREKLVRIDDQSLKFINIFPFQNDSVKVTAEMNAITTFSLQDDNMLKQELKDHIAGISIEDAKKYLQNRKEVDEVTVHVFPFWLRALPTIKENIHIIIKQE